MSKLRLYMVIGCFFVILLPLLSVAGENRRDGNWWRNQNELTKLSYMTGFFDGMDLGHYLSYWKFSNNAKLNACNKEAAISYKNNCDRYFNNVSSNQIVDGLDAFYEDYRNRTIRIADAVWIVVNEIAGMPKTESEKMIEQWRKKAIL